MPLVEADVISLALDPFVLMSATVIAGRLLGKIKFGKFSFGASGAMFVGLAAGWAAYKLARTIYNAEDSGAAGTAAAVRIVEDNGGKVIDPLFFTAALIIFVAATGLLAGKDLGAVIKKYGAKFIALAFIITFTGAAATYICSAFCRNTDTYAVTGVYTGALTSSPGLASAIETAGSHAEELADDYENMTAEEKESLIEVLKLEEGYSDITAENTEALTEEMKDGYVRQAAAQVGIGSAIGYPFGLIIVILAMNFLDVIFKIDIEEERQRYIAETGEKSVGRPREKNGGSRFSVISFAAVCLVGYLAGSLKLYMGALGYVSLEATGGVLISALVFSYIGKLGPLDFRMDTELLNTVSELSLSFFLAVVGLNYGYGAIDAVMGSGLTLAAVSLIVGFAAIMAGFLAGRFVFKLNWMILSGAICGGMTSTPGLGAAAEAAGSDEPAAGYGAAYPFALLGMVIFSMILNKLPAL